MNVMQIGILSSLFICMKKVIYRYRIYPNAEQKAFFAKCFGCVRFFYNKSLSDMNDSYKLSGKMNNITPASYKRDHPFLKEVDSLALSNAQLNRNAAFKAFFSHRSGFPKYKKKKSNQSYTTNMVHGNIKISENNRYISIPKCPRIRIRMHRIFNGNIKSVTVIKSRDDKYYVSLLVETNISQLKECDRCVGLDLGIKSLIVDSNGQKYENHKYMTKYQSKLKKEHRKLSKMVKGSNNRNKQRIKVARIYSKICNQRNDYLHKLSRKIIDENQVICIEDLKVKNLIENEAIAKSISDASWSKIVFMLTYKANWYGRTVIKVPANYPSSQLCSGCGHKNTAAKSLKVRKWSCPKCGKTHDRDINAAKNILSKGIEILTKGRDYPDSLSNLSS